ncbi:type VI secretion system protein TssA [Bordetella bronchiseptica]|uniref:type VI secretion system protein TssA n=1 Tax=Bordetella bronchiseptica TaxID=518 RepID=UPI00067E5015
MPRMTTNMEFADLLKTLTPSLPCGEDLEYDADFLQLQQAAVGRSEQQFGATIIPAQAPDWRAVERLALGLLERTRDLRIIAYLTRAWTEMRGLPGYAEGVTLAAGTLEQYWDAVHPMLASGGGEDPMPRVNALASLGDPQGCVRGMRSACLLDDVHGRLSLRDAEALLDGGRSEADYPGGRTRLIENLRQARLRRDDAALAVGAAAGALRRIQQQATQRLGSAWCPDYAQALRALDALLRTWSDLDETAAAPAAAMPAEAHHAAPAPEPQPAPASWHDARIATREDAMAMLAKVSAYFETHEPSHPAPYLIRRVQQLIPLDFHDILRNLAPQGLAQFEAWTAREAASQS